MPDMTPKAAQDSDACSEDIGMQPNSVTAAMPGKVPDADRGRFAALSRPGCRTGADMLLPACNRTPYTSGRLAILSATLSVV